MINYGESLKYQREINGLTQSKLAKDTGLNQQMISWWESGKGLPNIEFCVKLANFYNISLDELIGRTDGSGAITLSNSPKSKIEEIYEKLNRQNQLMALGYLTALLQKQNQA